MDISESLHFEKNVSLTPYNTFGIESIAKLFVTVPTPSEFVTVLQFAYEQKIPFRVFASGSNIVFPDEGLDGILIRVFGGDIRVEDSQFIVDAGVLLSDVITRAISLGRSGMEKLSGIPGTIGGGVVGNAGAYGQGIGDIVKQIEVWDGEKTFWLSRNECQFAYRESIFKKRPLYILRVTLSLKKGDKEELEKIARETITLREKKYKSGIKCPGSFFKNILVSGRDKVLLSHIDKTKIVFGKIPAGYLLDAVGARGMCVGDIEVAPFHGNLFINKGKGKAEDVKELARILKEKVKAQFDILLEEEIRYF